MAGTGIYCPITLSFPGLNNCEKQVNYNTLFICTAWREMALNYMQCLKTASFRPLHDESTLRVGTDSPSQYGAQCI
jgi:hypothetical protein